MTQTTKGLSEARIRPSSGLVVIHTTIGQAAVTRTNEPTLMAIAPALTLDSDGHCQSDTSDQGAVGNDGRDDNRDTITPASKRDYPVGIGR